MPSRYNRAILKHLGLLLIVGWIGNGCSGTAPAVQLEDAPDTLAVKERAVFEFSYNDNASTPLELQWDFGDGAVHNSLLTTHQFVEPGTYHVRFWARNKAGYDTETVHVHVTPPEPVSLTEVHWDPRSVKTGESVTFTGETTGDPPLTYDWSFGDGTTSTEAAPTHQYEEAGSYPVTVRVENAVATDTYETTVSVSDPLPPICTSISEFNPAFFESNSSTLTDESLRSLTENAEVLHVCPNLRLEVQGIALPDEDEPETLAQERAQAVIDLYVEEHDLPPNKVSVREGLVEDRPRTHVHTNPDGTKSAHKMDVGAGRRADTFPVHESP